MDVSSHSNGSPPSLVSRFQKNDLLPEETRLSGRQETGIEPRNRDHDDDLLITPDPSKCSSSSEAGLSPVSQSSLYPEQSMVETENDLAQDWTAKEIQPVSEVTAAIANEVSTASEVNPTVTKETGPASEVKTTVTKETDSASESNPTVTKETDRSSEVNPTVTKETNSISDVNSMVTKETGPASDVNATVTKETGPASDVNSVVTKETGPASDVIMGTKETDRASEVSPAVTKKTVLFSEVTAGTNETGPASELNTPIQPVSTKAEQDTEQVVADSHSLHDEEARITSDDEEQVTDTETEAEREDGTEDEDFAAGGNTVNFGDVDSFDMDDLLDDSSDEELPTLQEIYQRCQTIRNRRFYADLYNVWQRKIQEDEREDAIKILSASGFGKSGPDEIGDGLDKALSLVPERFWRNDSSANDISIEDLKMIVEERKDAEERAQYREYCQAAEAGSKSGGQARMRRSAIATGGGQSSAILHNYLKMNLLKSHVPMYYFPSYLQRFKEATKTDPESESEEENSDND